MVLEEGALVAATGFGIFFVLLWILLGIAILGLIVFLVVFWIMMIVDAAKRKYKDDGEKVAWILVVILVGWLGAIIYSMV